MTLRKTFFNGILSENPTFRLVLGMCPTMAITTTVFNGIGMGLAATFVLVFSNLAISLLRKATPEAIRIPAFVIAIATFVTIVQLVVEAFVPALHKSLGIFIPLIVVNCILFARVESFASKNGALASAVDAVGMGLGFTAGLLAIGLIREFLGSGSVFGYTLLKEPSSHMLIMVMAPGAFFTLGTLIMVMKHVRAKKGRE